MDSLAGDTFVEDSQVEISDIELDAANSLMQLQDTEVSTFEREKEIEYVSKTMFPVMFPAWYGLQDQEDNYAVTNLVCLSHGYTPSMLVVDEEDFGGLAFFRTSDCSYVENSISFYVCLVEKEEDHLSMYA